MDCIYGAQYKFRFSVNLGYHSDSPSCDWMKMIKYIGIGLAGLALVGCTQAAPAPVVTVTAPAPTVTVEPPQPTIDEFYGSILEEAWNSVSYKDKSDACFLFNIDRDEAWDAFNNGADNAIPRDQFELFFADKCSNY